MPLNVKITYNYIYYLKYQHLYNMTLNLDIVIFVSKYIITQYICSSTRISCLTVYEDTFEKLIYFIITLRCQKVSKFQIWIGTDQNKL